MKKRVGRKQNLEVDLRSEIKRSIEREGVTLSFDVAYKEFRRECEMKEYSKYTIQFYDNELKYVRRHPVEIEAPLKGFRRALGIFRITRSRQMLAQIETHSVFVKM